jgi:hypothetical protein
VKKQQWARDRMIPIPLAWKPVDPSRCRRPALGPQSDLGAFGACGQSFRSGRYPAFLFSLSGGEQVRLQALRDTSQCVAPGSFWKSDSWLAVVPAAGFARSGINSGILGSRVVLRCWSCAQ